MVLEFSRRHLTVEAPCSDRRKFHVFFVVDVMELGYVSVLARRFSPVAIIPPLPHTSISFVCHMLCDLLD